MKSAGKLALLFFVVLGRLVPSDAAGALGSLNPVQLVHLPRDQPRAGVSELCRIECTYITISNGMKVELSMKLDDELNRKSNM